MAHVKMYTILLTLFFIYADCKINKLAMTESMGQEVIEIGSPLKELPPDIEEEPSAEIDDRVTNAALPVATQGQRRKGNVTKINKDDEAAIEKELAELYRDTDYKADSAEATKSTKTTSVTIETEESETPVVLNAELPQKPIERTYQNFQFQPNDNSPKGIAAYRTAVDEINCDKLKLVGSTIPTPDSGSIRLVTGLFTYFLTLIVTL